MLQISINTKSSVPIYQQIVDQVKQLVYDEQLRPGEQIPAVREMARLLQVNPSTIARAYFDLKKAGVVAASRRRGTIIVGSYDGSWKNSFLENKLFNLVDNESWFNSDQKSRRDDLEAVFSLHLAQWKVQKKAIETRF